MKVLIVEDNYILAKNITKYLHLQGIDGDFVRTGEQAIEKITQETWSAIILDLNLPEISGPEVLRQMRNQLSNDTPVLILTSSSTNEDIVTGLNIGADDYMTKPFDYGVLLARLNALTRRGFPNKSELIELGNIQVDLQQKRVTKGDEEVVLSALEFDLLKFLLRKRPLVATRAEIYEQVWGEFEAYMFSRVVDIYIGHLRKKLGKELIQTRKGDGYFII